jgi:hypothetical protein
MSEITDPLEQGYIPISISLRPEDVVLLDRLAQEKKLSRSAFVRQIFGQWLRDLSSKFHPPTAGVFVDASGTPVFVGLLDDAGKKRVESGEWKLIKEF